MSSIQEKCKLDHKEFCFVCGLWFFSEQRRSITAKKFIDAYKERFNRDVNDRNVQWSPNVSCNNCYRRLLDKIRPIKYSTPVIWNEPKNHPEDCYFCKTIIPKGRNKFKRSSIKYPDPNTVSIVNAVVRENYDGDESDTEIQNVDSLDIEDEHETAPASKSAQIDDHPSTSAANASPPLLTQNLAIDLQSTTPAALQDDQSAVALSIRTISSHEQWKVPRHFSDLQPKRPKIQSPRLTQPILNDLIRDLCLSKTKSELLASRLVQLLKEFTPEVENGSYSLNK